MFVAPGPRRPHVRRANFLPYQKRNSFGQSTVRLAGYDVPSLCRKNACDNHLCNPLCSFWQVRTGGQFHTRPYSVAVADEAILGWADAMEALLTPIRRLTK